ncbi:hypothetical protein SAMN02745247_01113 [Butyrivibrio hungatei DSM 14810]|uniref:Uncharacterized protein n=1 Tax=Butyrivibrio hungatei DSM 14810 TaxID=1121132 RepID=A0A1M7S632_9FIRM|nr:hypothetical protein [Butyrivibrio hungatei]SHN53911.1 hypothetical protein SAMN02745247_01113 [Butyrivibrio hungatei DSM 14810]
MGLFGKKEDRREKIKSNVEKLMSAYDKEEIDGPTYMKKMMELSSKYKDKKKK